MLIGRKYTQKSNEFLCCDKQYLATIQLGSTTDSYDIDGQVLSQNPYIPSLEEVEKAIGSFQGQIEQIPPMFSAKKVAGKKLYELARIGIAIERAPVKVHLQIKLIRYQYPMLEIEVSCSKGTYIRSLAHDIGHALTCGAHLFELTRTRSGSFHLNECISQDLLKAPHFDFTKHLRQT
jgi:tRNA pseudouridine55 synthase